MLTVDWTMRPWKGEHASVTATRTVLLLNGVVAAVSPLSSAPCRDWRGVSVELHHRLRHMEREAAAAGCLTLSPGMRLFLIDQWTTSRQPSPLLLSERLQEAADMACPSHSSTPAWLVEGVAMPVCRSLSQRLASRRCYGLYVTAERSPDGGSHRLTAIIIRFIFDLTHVHCRTFQRPKVTLLRCPDEWLQGAGMEALLLSPLSEAGQQLLTRLFQDIVSQLQQDSASAGAECRRESGTGDNQLDCVWSEDADQEDEDEGDRGLHDDGGVVAALAALIEASQLSLYWRRCQQPEPSQPPLPPRSPCALFSLQSTRLLGRTRPDISRADAESLVELSWKTASATLRRRFEANSARDEDRWRRAMSAYWRHLSCHLTELAQSI